MFVQEFIPHVDAAYRTRPKREFRGIPHEFRVRDGAHTWGYWRTGIVGGLAFIGKAFRR